MSAGIIRVWRLVVKQKGDDFVDRVCHRRYSLYTLSIASHGRSESTPTGQNRSTVQFSHKPARFTPFAERPSHCICAAIADACVRRLQLIGMLIWQLISINRPYDSRVSISFSALYLVSPVQKGFSMNTWIPHPAADGPPIGGDDSLSWPTRCGLARLATPDPVADHPPDHRLKAHRTGSQC